MRWAAVMLWGLATCVLLVERLHRTALLRQNERGAQYLGAEPDDHGIHLGQIVDVRGVDVEHRANLTPGEDVPYEPFQGATLTDTFQITEEGDRADTSLIPVNNDRITAQLAVPIKVIVGNPPYSAGQGSANDDNANLRYPSLDARIAATYAARSSATNKDSLYDSYIRAFR